MMEVPTADENEELMASSEDSDYFWRTHRALPLFPPSQARNKEEMCWGTSCCDNLSCSVGYARASVCSLACFSLMQFMCCLASEAEEKDSVASAANTQRSLAPTFVPGFFRLREISLWYTPILKALHLYLLGLICPLYPPFYKSL